MAQFDDLELNRAAEEVHAAAQAGRDGYSDAATRWLDETTDAAKQAINDRVVEKYGEEHRRKF